MTERRQHCAPLGSARLAAADVRTEKAHIIRNFRQEDKGCRISLVQADLSLTREKARHIFSCEDEVQVEIGKFRCRPHRLGSLSRLNGGT